MRIGRRGKERERESVALIERVGWHLHVREDTSNSVASLESFVDCLIKGRTLL